MNILIQTLDDQFTAICVEHGFTNFSIGQHADCVAPEYRFNAEAHSADLPPFGCTSSYGSTIVEAVTALLARVAEIRAGERKAA